MVRHKDGLVAQGSHSLVPCQRGVRRGWGMQMEGVVHCTGKVEVVVEAHYIGTAEAVVKLQGRPRSWVLVPSLVLDLDYSTC